MIQWGKYDDARAAYNVEIKDSEPSEDDEPVCETVIEDQDDAEDGGNGEAIVKPLGPPADTERVVKVSEIPLLMMDDLGRNEEEESQKQGKKDKTEAIKSVLKKEPQDIDFPDNVSVASAVETVTNSDVHTVSFVDEVHVYRYEAEDSHINVEMMNEPQLQPEPKPTSLLSIVLDPFCSACSHDDRDKYNDEVYGGNETGPANSDQGAASRPPRKSLKKSRTKEYTR